MGAWCEDAQAPEACSAEKVPIEVEEVAIIGQEEVCSRGDAALEHHAVTGITASPNPNGWRDCPSARTRTPLVYLYGLAPGWYSSEWPAYVAHDDPAALTFTVEIGLPAALSGPLSGATIAAEAELEDTRRWVTRQSLVRLHQKSEAEWTGVALARCLTSSRAPGYTVGSGSATAATWRSADSKERRIPDRPKASTPCCASP